MSAPRPNVRDVGGPTSPPQKKRGGRAIFFLIPRASLLRQIIISLLPAQIERRWAVNSFELAIAKRHHIGRSELAQASCGPRIMGYCEFRPTGNGRPANNPTALARYLKKANRVAFKQHRTCFSAARPAVSAAPFYALTSPTCRLHSVAYSNLLSSAGSFYLL